MLAADDDSRQWHLPDVQAEDEPLTLPAAKFDLTLTYRQRTTPTAPRPESAPPSNPPATCSTAAPCTRWRTGWSGCWTKSVPIRSTASPTLTC